MKNVDQLELYNSTVQQRAILYWQLVAVVTHHRRIFQSIRREHTKLSSASICAVTRRQYARDFQTDCVCESVTSESGGGGYVYVCARESLLVHS